MPLNAVAKEIGVIKCCVELRSLQTTLSTKNLHAFVAQPSHRHRPHRPHRRDPPHPCRHPPALPPPPPSSQYHFHRPLDDDAMDQVGQQRVLSFSLRLQRMTSNFSPMRRPSSLPAPASASSVHNSHHLLRLPSSSSSSSSSSCCCCCSHFSFELLGQSRYSLRSHY